jgi:hypothetical protein
MWYYDIDRTEISPSDASQSHTYAHLEVRISSYSRIADLIRMDNSPKKHCYSKTRGPRQLIVDSVSKLLWLEVDGPFPSQVAWCVPRVAIPVIVA